jgi:hypothetical protein
MPRKRPIAVLGLHVVKGQKRKSSLRTANSLGLDASLFDDRPPFVDLGFVKGAERLSALLFARRDLLTELGELLACGRVFHGEAGRRTDLVDDLLGRALGRPNAVLDRHVKAG